MLNSNMLIVLRIYFVAVNMLPGPRWPLGFSYSAKAHIYSMNGSIFVLSVDTINGMCASDNNNT